MNPVFKHRVWELEVLSPWRVEDCEHCIEITQPEGTGAMHISSARKKEGTVTEAETLAQLKKDCPDGTDFTKTRCGDSTGRHGHGLGGHLAGGGGRHGRHRVAGTERKYKGNSEQPEAGGRDNQTRLKAGGGRGVAGFHGERKDALNIRNKLWGITLPNLERGCRVGTGYRVTARCAARFLANAAQGLPKSARKLVASVSEHNLHSFRQAARSGRRTILPECRPCSVPCSACCSVIARW